MNAAGIAWFVFKEWVVHRPIKHLRERRRRRREAKKLGKEVGLVNKDQGMSILRSVLKVVGAIAATSGAIEASQVDSFTAALVGVVGGVATIVGMVMSHKAHKK